MHNARPRSKYILNSMYVMYNHSLRYLCTIYFRGFVYVHSFVVPMKNASYGGNCPWARDCGVMLHGRFVDVVSTAAGWWTRQCHGSMELRGFALVSIGQLHMFASTTCFHHAT